MAKSYNNIGNVYYKQGDYAKAIEYYNKDLEISKKVLGENHPDVAITYNSLGNAYYSQSDYAIALEYYQNCYKIRKSTLGEYHPDTTESKESIEKVRAKLKRTRK